MLVTICESYTADSSAPAAARRLCARALDGMVCDSSSDADAALVVTELVTNAVNAGAHQLEVEVSVGDGAIRLAVSDDAGGQPKMIEPDTGLSPHGRGLQIVNAIARRWGTVSLAQGKQVWAELPP